MEGREQKKGIAVNTLYTMGGLLFMNAVLQIVITPLLNRMMEQNSLAVFCTLQDLLRSYVRLSGRL